MARYVDIEPYDNCVVVANKEDAGIKCKDIPAADVKEVVRGEWEEDVETGSLRCSKCGHLTYETFDVCEEKGKELAEVIGGDEHDVMFVLKSPYFCSKCGADMRGDK